MNIKGGLQLNFSVTDVLNRLCENREEHEKIYNEAMKGYKKKYREVLLDFLDQVERGILPTPNLKLQEPKHHLEEYDTAITMLGLTTEDEISLSQEQFNCYVMDKWYFQDDFLFTNLPYSDLAKRKRNV